MALGSGRHRRGAADCRRAMVDCSEPSKRPSGYRYRADCLTIKFRHARATYPVPSFTVKKTPGGAGAGIPVNTGARWEPGKTTVQGRFLNTEVRRRYTHKTITDPRIHHWDPPLGSTIQFHIRTSRTEPTHARAATPRRDHATRCPNPAAADSDAKKRPPPLALRAAIPTRPPPASRCPTPEQRAPPRYCIPRPELPENEKCGEGGATWKTGADGTADRSRRGRTRPRAAASPGSTVYDTRQPSP